MVNHDARRRLEAVYEASPSLGVGIFLTLLRLIFAARDTTTKRIDMVETVNQVLKMST